MLTTLRWLCAMKALHAVATAWLFIRAQRNCKTSNNTLTEKNNYEKMRLVPKHQGYSTAMRQLLASGTYISNELSWLDGNGLAGRARVDDGRYRRFGTVWYRCSFGRRLKTDHSSDVIACLRHSHTHSTTLIYMYALPQYELLTIRRLCYMRCTCNGRSVLWEGA